MAFIHTNFLTGNDTTGDGTTGLPYKTVFKALSVAASNDTIKVAGGQWSANLAGNFTFTQDSNVITTSVSQVGTVLVDDILSFEDGQFGFDKFHIKVLAVTAGSITTAVFWPMATTTVSDVKRLDAYHYSQATASPAQFETWNTTDIQPNGRTGITVSGGWSSDFSTQGGWTVARRTGQPINTVTQSPSLFNITVAGGLGQWGSTLVFDRFMAHTNALFVIATAAQGCSFAVGEIAMVKGSLLGSTGSVCGIWQANPVVPSKFYISTPGTLGFMNSINYNQSNNTNRPEVFEADVWTTLCWTTANTSGFTTQGVYGMASSVTKEGSINQINLKMRQNSSVFGSYAGYPASTTWFNSTRATYFKHIEYYCNKPESVWFVSAPNQIAQIQDLTLTGPYAAVSSTTFEAQSAAQYLIDLEAEGKTIDSFKPGTGTMGVAQGVNTQATFNQVCQTNLQVCQVKDSEGLKTLDLYNNIYFKNNGELKISSGTSFSSNNSVYYQWKVIGVVTKPTVPFEVSFTFKVDTGAEANWDYLGLQYGPNANQIIEWAGTPTDQFATYTFQVDPANYSEWNKFAFPLYFGIRAKTANTYNSETMTYAYIQSVSIV